MRLWIAALTGLAVLLPLPAAAAIIGHMSPAEPLTETRIALLPKAQQAPWLAYLARSRALMTADKAALADERAGMAAPPPAASGPSGGGGMPLDRPASWYAGAEARHVADNILSFQTPAGGWGKNQDRSGPARLRGQAWVAEDHAPASARPELAAEGEGWSYVGTIDNNATTSELAFLARVQAPFPGAEGEPYRAAFVRGLRYLLTAQFPNGGWPQVYPLQGGYHDALTYNDDALGRVVGLLAEVAGRAGDYGFVPADLAATAKAAQARAVDVILRTQIVIRGKRTIWAQQYDALTLAPAGARNFEPAALSATESGDLLVLLMRQPSPNPAVRAAIEAGIFWISDHQLLDLAWTRVGARGRILLVTKGAGPIWSRYYDLATEQPIFGDRDKSIHDDVMELSLERRNGYSWYNSGPARALKAYEKWRARLGAGGK
ncbi:MAG: pelA [Alphaproteobacteria bacterium]|nr:pelA [Alphaproteobacteria bacterium]